MEIPEDIKEALFNLQQESFNGGIQFSKDGIVEVSVEYNNALSVIAKHLKKQSS